MSPAAGVDRNELETQVVRASHLLAAHGGSIAVEALDDGGVVRVRFEGLCASCALRPITLEALVRPLLLAVEGVRSVEMVGLRISDEAAARLAASLGKPA